jgi:hypothetical protein
MKWWWHSWTVAQRINTGLIVIIAILTLVNVDATVVYVVTVRRAAKETGVQTDKLIAAANIQAGAATQNVVSAQQSAQAATDFAVQAAGINTQTEAAVRQFQRIAKDSEKALEANIEASRLDQRPWVGLQAVQCIGCTTAADRSLSVQDLVGVIVNTGKTPALEMVVDKYVAINELKSEPIPDWASVERTRKENEERAVRLPTNLSPDARAEISKALEKGKILRELKLELGGLHGFRHHRVSELVMAGVSMPMIRSWIGHGSDKMVSRYTHLNSSYNAVELAKVPELDLVGPKPVLVNAA